MVTDNIDVKYSDESDDVEEGLGLSGPDRGYRGPHLNFPLQRKDLDVLIDTFRKKKVRYL